MSMSWRSKTEQSAWMLSSTWFDCWQNPKVCTNSCSASSSQPNQPKTVFWIIRRKLYINLISSNSQINSQRNFRDLYRVARNSSCTTSFRRRNWQWKSIRIMSSQYHNYNVWTHGDFSELDFELRYGPRDVASSHFLLPHVAPLILDDDQANAFFRPKSECCCCDCCADRRCQRCSSAFPECWMRCCNMMLQHDLTSLSSSTHRSTAPY